MTLQPSANRNDVLYQSGVFGMDANLSNNVPPEITTTTTGNATVSTTQLGLDVQPGATAGDTAQVRGPRVTDVGKWGDWISTYLFECATATPFTDDIEIGMKAGNPGTYAVNETSNVYILDLTTEEFRLESTTQSVTIPNRFDRAVFQMEYRSDTDELTMRLRFKGESEQSHTFSNAGAVEMGGGRVLTESNGSDDNVQLGYVRDVMSTFDNDLL
jgi:hypothetical protein